MQLLTVPEIRAIKRRVAAQFSGATYAQVVTRQRFDLSLAIIERATGLAGETLREAAAGYLDTELREGDGWINVARIFELGDLLHLLRIAPGFDQFITKLRTEPWEPTVAVLHFAGALHRAGHTVGFVAESGEKTKDYDIVVTIDGVQVYIEAKCKLESTSYTPSGLLATLKKAGTQLPKSGPGVVIVQIPQSWYFDATLNADAGTVTRRFLRDARRVNGVLFMGTVNTHTPEGLEQDHWKWYQANHAPRTPVSGLENLVVKVNAEALPGTQTRIWASYWIDD